MQRPWLAACPTAATIWSRSEGRLPSAVEGCLPSALGARVRLSNGTLTLTDGRFTESKEVIGGLAILRANSKEEAIETAKQFLCEAGKGECKLRQLFEADQNTQAQKTPKS